MNTRLALALGASAYVAAPAVARAQADSAAPPASDVGGRSEVFAGGELEGYLRYLQTLGVVAPHPWSIRAFSPRELDAMLPRAGADHPWRARYALVGGRTRGPRFDYVRPTTSARYNTGFAWGSNDGPIWAGRGLTTAVQAGVAARWGPLSATLAPIAFWAENRAFALGGNGYTGALRYNDVRFPFTVDRPRRFGDAAYAVVDPGQSTLRLDAGPLAVGASTANQTWGPGDRYPMVLSNNAAGYPHVFLGTSGPVNLRIATVNARVVWGRLDQSDYSPVRGSESFVDLVEPGRRRFASGLVAVVQPRGLAGVELGATRFFHSPWRDGGPTARDFRKPFEALYKRDVPRNELNPSDPSTDFDNQLASLFMRWVVGRSGFELSGEYFKEDHNFDSRDLVLEPDHNAGYMLGVRKAFRRRSGDVVGLRAEIVGLEISPIGLHRPQGLNYVGGYLRQGHTQLGQLLGADVGVGSTGGSTAGVDWYTRRGRWSAAWSRTLRADNLPRLGFGESPPAQITFPRAYDVVHTLGGEGVLFRGPLDITAGLTGAWNLNREFGDDAFNLNGLLAVRYNLR
jgi:hypothetical protein